MGGSGAGSGGGGGSSGSIDYPSYMKDAHSWLMREVEDYQWAAIDNNPYNMVQAFSPDYMIKRQHAGLKCYEQSLQKFDPLNVWKAFSAAMPEIAKSLLSPADIRAYLQSPDITSIFEDVNISKGYSSTFSPGAINNLASSNWDSLLPISDMSIFDPATLNNYLRTIPLDYFGDTSALDTFIDAQKARLCRTTEEQVLPRYRRGMQDIGAVVSSAFKIGEALLWARTIDDMAELEAKEKNEVAKLDKEYRGKMALSQYDYMGKLAVTEYSEKAKAVHAKRDFIGKEQLVRDEHYSKALLGQGEAEAKHNLEYAKAGWGIASSGAEYQAKSEIVNQDYYGKAGLLSFEYLSRGSTEGLQLVLQKLAYQKDILHYFLEIERMSYTAYKEFTDTKNIYEIEKVKWPLEMFKYRMDALGAISASAGTSYTTSASGTSRLSSAIGGALTGAGTGMAMGAMMGSAGGPIGAAVGGAIGLIGGLFG